MKKLGLLLTLAFLTQSVAADKNSSYSSLAVLLAETGASSSWLAKEIPATMQDENRIDLKLEDINNKLNLKIEQRFNRQLESSMNGIGN